MYAAVPKLRAINRHALSNKLPPDTMSRTAETNPTTSRPENAANDSETSTPAPNLDATELAKAEVIAFLNSSMEGATQVALREV